MGTKTTPADPTPATPATPTPATKDLTGDDILAADDCKLEPVDVPEWGGRVYVKVMSAEERERYDDLILDDDGKVINDGRLRAKLVVCACCSADRKPLFTKAHVARLAEKCGTAVIRVYDAALTLNKLRQADAEGEKKGSPAAPAAG